MVPGIDTDASFNKHSTAFQFNGCLTPPQSAHESRRPSYCDLPHSAASTATSFSVPPTPVHSVPHHTYYTQSQVLGDGLTHDVFSGNATSLSSRGFDQPLQPVNNKTPEYVPNWPIEVVHQPTSGPYSLQSATDAVGGQWSDRESFGHGFTTPALGLQSTLYSTGSDMLSQSSVLGSSFTGSGCSLASNTSALSSFGYDSGPDSYYQPQEVVDPSQVSPQDMYGVAQCSQFGSPDKSLLSAPSSFSSASEYIDHFESAHPPSPIANYYMGADDSVMIKDESSVSPNLYSGIGQTRGAPHQGHPRPRDFRRRAKTQRRKPTHSQEGDCYGVTVRIEGEVIGAKANGLPILRRTGKNQKLHKCKFVLDDGTVCNEGFERSEHLKRHMGKHASKEERMFPCPLANDQKKCDKIIGRSDNACDHFKTHLKQTEKNRRNDFFYWEEVSNKIREAYSEKASTKIRANLMRWLLQPENRALRIKHGLVHGVQDEDSM